ncbi:hypothetical protein [Nocardioides dilutus]
MRDDSGSLHLGLFALGSSIGALIGFISALLGLGLGPLGLVIPAVALLAAALKARSGYFGSGLGCGFMVAVVGLLIVVSRMAESFS